MPNITPDPNKKTEHKQPYVQLDNYVWAIVTEKGSIAFLPKEPDPNTETVDLKWEAVNFLPHDSLEAIKVLVEQAIIERGKNLYAD